ncbi:hypothetical protein M0802_004738 [Mischocyttarus mexicanus]|nr:hypothetical protein M0802_004738 [Mischocyttarus mexicanus]
MAALWLYPLLRRSKAKKTGGCLPEDSTSLSSLSSKHRSNDLGRSSSKGKVGKPGSAGWSYELAISSSKQYALMAT